MQQSAHRNLRKLAAAGLAAALVLAACGSGDDDTGAGEEAGGGAAQPGATADPSAFPVEIEHTYGTTTVEEEPGNVVTVGLTDQDPALALGVVPVGTNEWFTGHDGNIMPWATDELEAAGGEVPESIGDSAGLNYEQIAALRPDLILAVYAGLTQEEYDTLSAIAPTVAQPEEYPDWGVPWQEQTRIIGTALGRADEAEALVTDVEAQFDAAREAHPEFEGTTGAMATVWDGQVVVYTSDDPRGRFLDLLGFEQIPGLADMSEDGFSAEISAEQVDIIDVDALVWIVSTIEEDMPQIQERPVYEGLGLTDEGREVPVENDSALGSATSYQSVLSIPDLLDGMVPMLAAAVDGDPATEVVQPS